MKSIPTWFFATAAIFALCGMVWGIQMSATHDHTLSPAHGHLNLIGFVSMSVFGTYYALTPSAAASRPLCVGNVDCRSPDAWYRACTHRAG